MRAMKTPNTQSFNASPQVNPEIAQQYKQWSQSQEIDTEAGVQNESFVQTYRNQISEQAAAQEAKKVEEDISIDDQMRISREFRAKRAQLSAE